MIHVIAKLLVIANTVKQSHTPDTAIDSPQAAWRLLTTLLLMLLGRRVGTLGATPPGM